MGAGIWNTLETLAEGHPPAAVLAEWQQLLNGDFVHLSDFLRVTQRLAGDFPCLSAPDCGCRHEPNQIDDERWIARCMCHDGDCPATPLAPTDLIVHELDILRFGSAVARALGFDEQDGIRYAAPKFRQVGFYPATQSPVYLALCPNDGQLIANLEGLAASGGEPFILLAPTGRSRTETVDLVLARLRCAYIPLSAFVALDGPGKFRVTNSIKPVLDRFVAGWRGR